MKKGETSSSTPHKRNLFGASFFLLIALGLIGYALVVSNCLEPGKLRIIGFICALAAGLAGVFLSGELGIVWEPDSTLGKIVIKGAGGMGMFLLVLWWWSASPHVPNCPQTYRVRVNVVNEKKEPVTDFEAWNSLENIPVTRSQFWAFEVPEAKKPPDGKFTVSATKKSAYLSGTITIALGDDYDVTEPLRLSRDTSARIHGRVVDSKGASVEGARICVHDRDSEAVITGVDGRFDLLAHAGEGERVQLYAIKGNFDSREWYPAGSADAIVILKRKR